MSGAPFYPLLASEHGGGIDALMLTVHVIVAAVFLAWFGLFAYLLVRFRGTRKKHPVGARPRPRWLYGFAVLLLAVELVLDLGFSNPYGEAGVDEARNEDAVELRVVAQQYTWNVHYPGADGAFGRTDPLLVRDDTNPLGLVRDDAAAKDDIVLRNQMVLPVNRPAVIYLSSKDVIHSLNLPEFRVKQDAIPGMMIPVGFTPTMTTAEFQSKTGDETRDFEIACAQLCGLAHYNMRGVLRVVPEADFKTWLAQEAPTEEDEVYDDFWE